MKDLLIPAMLVSLLLLWATCEATPAARSARQMWTAVRRTGCARTAFTVARVAVVVVLLILADLCRLAGHDVKAVRVVAKALAVHAEILGAVITRAEVRA